MEQGKKNELLKLPRINLNERQLCDLELLLNGGFSPLEGFLDEEDYNSVLERIRLKNGLLWPMPVVLDVASIESHKVENELILCDQYGNPLAVFFISSVYSPNKLKEAELVYGSTDKDHPGVKYLLEEVGDWYMGGKLKKLELVPKYDFHEFRHTPNELKKWFAENNWSTIIGFQTRNPIHRAHFEIIKKAAEDINAKVLIHPVIGMTKEGDIDYVTRVRSYKKLYESYMKDFAKLSLLPLAMRMAGPREALWHAIIRRNYGCTHFIVGRDHAGPGKDSQGKSFYKPYAAQDLTNSYADEIGINIIPVEEICYHEKEKRYIPVSKMDDKNKVKNISGTELREMLKNGEEIPEWFSFPEVIEELRKGAEKEKKTGFTIFLTGLPCSGKSTVANILYSKLLELQDRKITLLDGDVIRDNLSKGLGFSRNDRDINITRIGFVANEITKHGGIAICAAIAPYEQTRQKNRSLISKNGTYVEVYLSTPIEVCMQRDSKGMYKKAEMGLIRNFTGVDAPYEAPESPELILDTTDIFPQECIDEIIKFLKENKLF